MIVTNKLKYETPQLFMGGKEIKLVDEIKILGVIIDKKLKFNSHVSYFCQKSINIYKLLARAAKISWGLKPEVIRTIYVSVIEPVVMYAASVWAPAVHKKAIKNQLNAVQRGFENQINQKNL